MPHGDRQVRVDLNIDGDIDIASVTKLTSKLSHLTSLEATAREAMVSDFGKKNSSVGLFRDHHAALLDAVDSATSVPATKEDIRAFLQRCELQRVAFYPECPGHCIILDFAFREPVTDYMLVVSLDGKDKVVGVDMQS